MLAQVNWLVDLFLFPVFILSFPNQYSLVDAAYLVQKSIIMFEDDLDI